MLQFIFARSLEHARACKSICNSMPPIRRKCCGKISVYCRQSCMQAWHPFNRKLSSQVQVHLTRAARVCNTRQTRCPHGAVAAYDGVLYRDSGSGVFTPSGREAPERASPSRTRPPPMTPRAPLISRSRDISSRRGGRRSVDKLLGCTREG